MPAKRKAVPAVAPRPLVRVRSSVPSKQAQDFLHDRGDDAYALKGLGTDRDMTPVERLKAVRLSRLNYKRSGIYGQLVDTLANFVVGEGVVVKAAEDSVQDFLDAVFDDPINDFYGSLRSRYTTTVIDGEYLLGITIPLRGASAKGEPLSLTAKPMLGRMDSDAIAEVHVSQVNQDKVLAVTVEPGEGKPKVTYPVAVPGTAPRDNGDGTATAVLLWRVNTLKRRGLPFFSRTLDKAHMLDGVVDELARKAKYTSRFWLHGTYEDQGTKAKNSAIEKKLLAWLRSWTPGEALASTKGVEVNCFAPDLKLQDQKALYDLVVDYVLGSHGIPRHWFSSGGDTNRATSVEQGTPIFRSVDAAQSQFMNDLTALIDYLVWLGKESGAIPKDADEEVHIVPSDVATRDSIRDTKEVGDLVLALDGAVASAIISPEERQRIGRRVLASKGWGEEIDPDDAPPLAPEGGLLAPLGQGEGDPALREATVPGTGLDGGAGAGPGLAALPGGTDVQATAMNGAQVASLLTIVQAVADGTLPSGAAEPMILAAFPAIPPDLVQEMLDEADAFDPPKPEPVVVAAPPPGASGPPKPKPEPAAP